MMKIILSALLALGQGIAVSAQDTVITARTASLSQFNYEKPLFSFKEEQLENRNRLLRYSALTGYREGVLPLKGQFNVNFAGYNDEVTGTRRIYMYNLSVEELLTHGLKRKSRVLLDVKDPSRYRYDPEKDTLYGSETEWLRKNGYCFEMLLPIGALKGMETIDNAVKRRFGLSTVTEEREVNTLTLVRTSVAEKYKPVAAGSAVMDASKGLYRNVGFAWLGESLEQYGLQPFFNATGYAGLADLDLGINMQGRVNLEELRKALLRYDLDLKTEKHKVLMFVISENKQP